LFKSIASRGWDITGAPNSFHRWVDRKGSIIRSRYVTCNVLSEGFCIE
jgi:hypothetical protein